MSTFEQSQASRVRVSTLTAEIYRLLTTFLDSNPELTHEEILLAAHTVAGDQIRHLMARPS